MSSAIKLIYCQVIKCHFTLLACSFIIFPYASTVYIFHLYATHVDDPLLLPSLRNPSAACWHAAIINFYAAAAMAPCVCY